jgi:CO/xanthine dehydrogenase Mo-binding subunit
LASEMPRVSMLRANSSQRFSNHRKSSPSAGLERNEKSLGAGEGSQGPAVAAIVNAFGNATGKRIRELPLTRDRVKAALG